MLGLDSRPIDLAEGLTSMKASKPAAALRGYQELHFLGLRQVLIH